MRPAPERASNSSDRWIVLDGNAASRTTTTRRPTPRLITSADTRTARSSSPSGSPSPTARRRLPSGSLICTTPQLSPAPDFAPRPTVPEAFPKRSVPARNGDLFVNRDATPEAAREMIRAYWAAVTWTDWNIGRVIAELDRLKLRDDTILVFCG